MPSTIASPMRPDWLPMLDVEYERVAARQKTSDVTRRSSACGVVGRRNCDELELCVERRDRQLREDDEHHGDGERVGGEHRRSEAELAPEAAPLEREHALPSAEPHEHRRRRRRLIRTADSTRARRRVVPPERLAPVSVSSSWYEPSSLVAGGVTIVGATGGGRWEVPWRIDRGSGG